VGTTNLEKFSFNSLNMGGPVQSPVC